MKVIAALSFLRLNSSSAVFLIAEGKLLSKLQTTANNRKKSCTKLLAVLMMLTVGAAGRRNPIFLVDFY